jgi:hypothetical protein
MNKSILAVSLFMLSLSGMATTYTCTSTDYKVKVTAVQLSETTGTVKVLSPFRKQMKCDVSTATATKGSKSIKTFICGDGDSIPDIFAVDEKRSKGMIEVVDQAHYDLNCKIR